MKSLIAALFIVASAVSFAGQDCCKKKLSADEKFLEQAQQMLLASEGKKEKPKACCVAKAAKAAKMAKAGKKAADHKHAH